MLVAVPVGVGIVVGAGLSLWASTFVASLLHGVLPRDLQTLVGAAVMLAEGRAWCRMAPDVHFKSEVFG